MIPYSLIKNAINPVRTSYTGNQVIAILDESKLSHIPIVNNQDYLGLISETDLFNNNLNEPIGNYKLTLPKISVLNENHLYDSIRQICEMRLSLIPVVNTKNIYLGYLDLQSIVEHFGNDMSINNPGAIIELELTIQDYSLSEITHVIETNDVKILNIGITTYKDSTKILVTIKLDRLEVSNVVQALNRYGYSVSASYGDEELNDYLKDRYDSLMNYLNI